jgi:hypothetical protein
MSIKSRLNRLEQNRPWGRFPGWEMLMGQRPDRWLAECGYADLVEAVAAGESDPLLVRFALWEWLAARGHADALAAVEAGETGPKGLEDLLREQAGYDAKRRAFARIEKALAAGVLPDKADVRLQTGQVG